MASGTNSATSSLNSNANSINDPLYIASSDHPGMVLTNTLFNGGNFHGWSRTVKMALGAKLKLGFIDGTCTSPTGNALDLQRWIRCDYMVTCWILNSMVSDLSKAFLYAQSAFELWKEIAERYGQSNGPLIYQLEHELSKISQENLSIAAYFNKLKKCWDELHNLNGIPVCTCGKMNECSCGILAKFLETEGISKLVQFLMKLNDDYESVRNQILSMDPLPNVNKAYYIVQQVEKQKEVTNHCIESTAFFANTNTGRNGYVAKKDPRSFKYDVQAEGKKHCTYCKFDGHVFEQCFERLGYPDWYKGKKNKKGPKLAANVHSSIQDFPFDMNFEDDMQNGLDPKLITTVCHEMMKMFKTKGHFEDTSSSSNHAHAGI